jgi:hypothetical protein
MTTVAAFVPVCASLVLPDSVAQFINGATLLALGVSIAFGDRYPNGLALWVRRRSGLRRWWHCDCSYGLLGDGGLVLTPATVLLAVSSSAL